MQSYQIPHYAVRLVRERTRRHPVERVDCAKDAARVAHALIAMQPHESVLAIMLNGQNRIIGTAIVSQGGLHGCAVMPCDVFRPAVCAGASAIVLAHNHPSGNPEPSHEDIAMTRAVRNAGKVLGVALLDHVIVTTDVARWSSLAGVCGLWARGKT